MKSAALFLVVTCCAFSALSLDGNAKRSKPSATVSPAQEFSPSVTAPPTTTPAPNTTTTTPAPTTTTTTHAPNTTTTTHAPNTTTTTHAPNTTTTTHAANTTTTTHAANTTTTTHTPNTTTTTHAPTTPTPPGPTPPTNLTVGNYSIKTDNKICLMAKVALQIRLEKANMTFKVQPDKTTAEGWCQKTTANLTLTFKEGLITFMFNQSTADNIVYVNQVSFNISYTFKSLQGNGRYIAKNDSLRLFAAKVGHSYSCREESIYMGNGLYLDVSKDQMQAFNLTANKDFGPPEVCEHDKPDYSVAIGVGVALLVLIVIVLVVYFVSRKRRSDGYQSL